MTTTGEQAIVLLSEAYTRSRRQMLAYASNRLSSQDDAEDAVSETYVRAVACWPQYRPASGIVEAWLYGILGNTCHEFERRASRNVPVNGEEWDSLLIEEDSDAFTQECLLISAHFRLRYAHIPKRDRALLFDRLNGLTWEELAAAHNISVRTARGRTEAIYEALRDCPCPFKFAFTPYRRWLAYFMRLVVKYHSPITTGSQLARLRVARLH
jgi:RNA polymerase sigma factor (sigma-70 family)